MRISSGNITGGSAAAVQPVTETAPADAPRAAAPAAGEALQSAVLQPAVKAMQALPDFDHEKVAQLRDALARGELPFNAGKLAGMIQRFHGN